ncbi:MAG: lactonase family protein [bacterium]
MAKLDAGPAARILIGTYTGAEGAAGVSRGLYAADWNGGTGVLGEPHLLAELKNPSFLAAHPTRPLVYAVSEVRSFGGKETGAVAALRLDGDAAVIEGVWPSHGTSPCHVTTDPRGEFLVVSNYGSGTVAVYPLADGLPRGEARVLRLEGSGPDRQRQSGPHAHSACFEPGGDRFWVQDLGTDRLWGFVLDRAARAVRPLVPSFTQLSAGCGPRHLAFHPRGRWAYVINELDSTVIALARDAKRGSLTPFQTVSTLSAAVRSALRNDCADIHVSPDGASLYGSNRGHDNVAVWRIAAKDGRLAPVQHVSSGGGHPRNFTLSPDGRWLLAANMNSDNIVVFRRDRRTGTLERTGATAAPHPVCLLFAPSPAR